MKIVIKGLLSCIALFVLNGCDEKVYTVDYYFDHRDEMEAKLKECKNNPGVMQNNPNCVNAATASRKSVVKPLKSNGKTMDDYFK